MALYPRGGKIWWRFTNVQGVKVRKPSGFLVGEEAKAEKAWALLQRKIKAERELAAEHGDDPASLSKGATIAMYAAAWLKRRKIDKPQAAEQDAWQLDGHILPALGALPLAELRPRHVRDFVRDLRAKKKATGESALASRSICTIYGTLHCMMREAVVDELLATNPCVLKHGDLPRKADRNPDWRAGAVYTRGEVEAMISDERIPEDRRVLYAVLFLAGMRPGEAFALRWRSYDPAIEPLGRLDIVRAFDSDGGEEKDTKTGNRRLVPVHPTLAKVLAAWRLGGWQRLTGRAPQPDDLLLPEVHGEELEHMTVDQARKLIHKDLAVLGWRKRRLYDTRRTFISLAQGDGASRETLRWVTHGPRGDVMDLYTSIPWQSVCAEVAKLCVGLLAGTVLPLRRAACAVDVSPVEHSEGRKEPVALVPADPQAPGITTAAGGTGAQPGHRQAKGPGIRGLSEWARLESNQRPLASEANALSS